MKKITSILLIVALLCCSVVMFASCDDDVDTDAHTHSYGSPTITVPASCVSPGSSTSSCACGNTVTNIIPALGHHFVGGVCTDCGASQ